MKQHSEFAIIGGGVLGVSLAYQLSLHGRGSPAAGTE